MVQIYHQKDLNHRHEKHEQLIQEIRQAGALYFQDSNKESDIVRLKADGRIGQITRMPDRSKEDQKCDIRLYNSVVLPQQGWEECEMYFADKSVQSVCEVRQKIKIKI